MDKLLFWATGKPVAPKAPQAIRKAPPRRSWLALVRQRRVQK